MFRSGSNITRFVTVWNAINAIDVVTGCSRLIGYLGRGQTEIANFDVIITVQKNVDRLKVNQENVLYI